MADTYPLPALPHTASQQERPTRGQEDHAVLVLDEAGWIRDCNSYAEILFGFAREDLATRHISLLIPQLADRNLLQDGDIDSRIKLLSCIGWPFRAKHRAKTTFRCRLFLSHPGNSKSRNLRLIVRRDESGKFDTRSPLER